MSPYAATSFRAINERVRLLVEPFETPQGRGHPIPFVCECRSERCFATVEATLAEFEAICADDEHRLIRPGHQVQGEQVVVETPAYAVVRLAEFGEAGYSGFLEASGESRQQEVRRRGSRTQM